MPGSRKTISSWTDGRRPVRVETHSVTVVRTTAEALELVEGGPIDQTVETVISSVRPGSNDAANLRRIVRSGTHVVAIAEHRDVDALPILTGDEFDVWDWSEDWLAQVRWPRSIETASAPIPRYERGLVRRAGAPEDPRHLSLGELDQAYGVLREIERIGRESGDESLSALVSDAFQPLVAACRRCTPLSDDDDLGLMHLDASIRQGERYWPDDALDRARDARGALAAAIEQLRSKNPKFEALREWVSAHPKCTVLARRADHENLCNDRAFDGTRILSSPQGVPSDAPLIITSWLGRRSMEKLLWPPRSPQTRILLYGPEADWYDAFRHRRHSSTNRLAEAVARHSPIRIPHERKSAPQTPEPDTIRPPLDIDVVLMRGRRDRALRELDSNEDEQVKARLVFFAGGSWAAFKPNFVVNTISQSRKSGSTDLENAIQETRARDLQPGDRVVLVRGSDRDAIRHAADETLPVGLRDQAAIWRGAMQRFVLKGNPMRVLRERLAKSGCKRTMHTVGEWLSDEQIIGPRRALQGDLEAILDATGDEILQREMDACKGAIARVRQEHWRVAGRLAQQVLERAQEWLDVDTAVEDLVEVEERLVLASVDWIDEEMRLVSRRQVNRLQESA